MNRVPPSEEVLNEKVRREHAHWQRSGRHLFPLVAACIIVWTFVILVAFGVIL